MIYELERRAALEAVIKACKLASAVQAAHLAGGVLDKEDKSPVTVADFGAQAVVSEHLAAVFPHDPLVGEESSALLRLPENAQLKDSVLKHVRMITPRLSEKDVFAAIDRGSAEGGSKGRFWTLDPLTVPRAFCGEISMQSPLRSLKMARFVSAYWGAPVCACFSSGAGWVGFRSGPRTGRCHHGNRTASRKKNQSRGHRKPF